MTQPPDPIDPDRRWLAQVAAQGQDAEDALCALFRRHRVGLLRQLRRQGLTLEQAEDAVQDTFVSVMEKAGTYRGESQVSAWLFRIAANHGIDRLRRTGRETLMSQEDWDAVEPDLPAAPAAEQQLDRLNFERCYARQYPAFAKAHPDMADALEKIVTLGWRGQDLAVHLGRSYLATRQYLTSCRDRLRRFLEPCAMFWSGTRP